MERFTIEIDPAEVAKLRENPSGLTNLMPPPSSLAKDGTPHYDVTDWAIWLLKTQPHFAVVLLGGALNMLAEDIRDES